MSRIDSLLAYLVQSPKDSFLRHALALEYIKLGKDDEALELFTSLLKDEPGYVGSYYHLAKLWERKGRPEEAIKSYREGMDVAKAAGDRHSYNELQMALEELED
ncbi:MAG TPA: hypothetical protein DCQ34_03585 [Chitinophagaceae bacterium]|nr:hypothetical protein [Chitinophagaceae bacterium]HCY89968.1 hypothetical protein [Chitinophagaceae bacterium]HRF26003.1 tetratricopeptide repeat protein [Ferruginibacter sp.]